MKSTAAQQEAEQTEALLRWDQLRRHHQQQHFMKDTAKGRQRSLCPCQEAQRVSSSPSYSNGTRSQAIPIPDAFYHKQSDDTVWCLSTNSPCASAGHRYDCATWNMYHRIIRHREMHPPPLSNTNDYCHEHRHHDEESAAAKPAHILLPLLPEPAMQNANFGQPPLPKTVFAANAASSSSSSNHSVSFAVGQESEEDEDIFEMDL